MNHRHSFSTSVATAYAALLLIACSEAPSNTGSGGSGGQSGGAGTTAAGASGSGGMVSKAGGGGASGSGNTAGSPASGGSSAGGGAGGSGQGGGGSGSGGSAGGGGKTEVVKSPGCTEQPTQMLNQWVESMVMTSGSNRPYSVRLPSGYDPMRAYPVVMLLHGCTGGDNNVPIQNASGADAILVRGTGSAANTCWNSSANGPDVAFFDAMVADVKVRFCSDENRFFAVGYSSGSWLVNQLTCIRADVLRGGASVSGGETAGGDCGGPVARIFLHDEDDEDNHIEDSERARDRQLTQNMCDEAAAPMPVDPSPCVLYQGCATGYPVQWCPTMGKQHGRQDDFAPDLFWNFFKAL
jgi:polyhydroxybutyrate depolymerase